MKINLFYIVFLLCVSASAQGYLQYTLFGRIKLVHDYVILIDTTNKDAKGLENEWNYYHWNPSGKRMSILNFNSHWYDNTSVHYLNFYRKYNEQKQIEQEEWRYMNDTIIYKYVYSYTKEGNVSEIKQMDENGQTDIIERWGYNHNNKLMSNLTVYFWDNGYHFIGYEYHNGGKLASKESFDEDGKSGIMYYEYDNGNLAALYYAESPAWEKILKLRYEYDDHGNRIVVKNYADIQPGSKYPPHTMSYTYNKNNSITSIRDNLSEFTYDKKYNNTNQLISSNSKLGDKLYTSEEYYYANNVVIKIKTYKDGKTSTVNFTYKFDSQNNWTEQTKSVNGKKLYIRKRDIVYY